MKKLVFIRHAKSSWEDTTMNDHDRPLNKKGKEAAITMSKAIIRHVNESDAVFSSTAKRAKQTIEIITQGDAKIEYKPALYTFDYKELLAFVKKMDDSLERVIIVGHNAAFTDAINDLSSSKIFNLPTCGIAVLLWDEVINWQKIESESARIIYFDTPKNYRK